MEQAERFNPKAYLSRVGGNDYLEVKWRMVWLRSDHPDAIVNTELVEHGPFNGTDNRIAIFKATITIPDAEVGGELVPRGAATGYGSETYDDFHDYIEKAETKALGRACAALGYGSQFDASEFEDVEPVNRGNNRNRSNSAPNRSSQPTPQQWEEIRKWREANEINQQTMGDIIQYIVGKKDGLTKDEVGKVLYKIRNTPLADIIDALEALVED